MSITPVRRPLPVAAPSAPPPVFAIASGHEPRARRRRGWIAPASFAIAAVVTFGVVFMLLHRRRSLG